MEVTKFLEHPKQVTILHSEASETSDGCSRTDVREPDIADAHIVVEESLENTPIIISDSDSFGTPSCPTMYPSGFTHEVAALEQENDNTMDTGEDQILDLSDGKEQEKIADDAAEEEEPSTRAGKREIGKNSAVEDQNLAEDQSEEVMEENGEAEEGQKMEEAESPVQSGAGDDTAGSAVLEESTEDAAVPADPQDSGTVSADKDEPTDKPRPAALRSKTAVRQRTPKAKKAPPTQKAGKARLSKVAVPTVTVTAPSDQSDDSEAGTPLATSTPCSPALADSPLRIENNDKLPPGWKRVLQLRKAGLYMGRYDTTLYSDTRFKMRSFPNVRNYLEKYGLLHYLEDKRYDFKFRQPFSTPKRKERLQSSQDRAETICPPSKGSVKAEKKTVKVKALNIDSPVALESGSTKASKSKSPASTSKKTAKSELSTPTIAKMCVTLKRKLVSSSESEGGSGSQELGGRWEVQKPSKASPNAKARKRTTHAARKDSPQLKLDGIINKHKLSQNVHATTESKFKTSLKTLLHKSLQKSRQEAVTKSMTASQVETEPHDDTTSGKSKYAVEGKVVKTADRVQVLSKNVKNKAQVILDDDDGTGVISDSGADKTEVILDNDVNNGNGETVSDVYLAEEQEEPFHTEDEEENQELLIPPHHEDSNGKLSDRVTSATANKRSRSPSDSDVSVCKRARVWREADMEEDSSRSAGVCSDLSLPGGVGAGAEDDDNQNMSSKVQKLHLWDSSSSMRDSASTSSSNSGSLPVTTASSQLLSPPASRIASRTGTVSSPSVSSSASVRRRVSQHSFREYVTSTTTNAADMVTAVAGSRPRVDAHRTGATVNTNGGGPGRNRDPRDRNWHPPSSPYNLIQERLWHDTWKMLIGTIILPRLTSGKINLLWRFLNWWPSADTVSQADTQRIASVLNSMEDSHSIAATIVKFSEEYLSKDWTYPKELHGINKYGDDSYRIFSVREWQQVQPEDQQLSNYCEWLSRYYQGLELQ